MQSFRVPPGRDRTTSLHLSKEKAKKSGDTIPKGKKKDKQESEKYRTFSPRFDVAVVKNPCFPACPDI
jgi:hypothetical protein